eukprot:TRINITY_DN4029_c0_g1_i1.p1 TRINITY_DN4029_c0_g1~~TRINITY_DN4029_c0_g1_i1.p1  ORF type:complete len:593 (+),score=111.05 TRINITY_DN4029_c0_g1_i1:686-2464(+)
MEGDSVSTTTTNNTNNDNSNLLFSESGDIFEDEREIKPKIPQEQIDQERGFNEEELKTCTKVLSELSKRPDILNSPDYSALRHMASIFIDGMSNKYFGGHRSATEYHKKHERKMFLIRKEQQRRDLDRNRINSVSIRNQRLETLNKLTIKSESDDTQKLITNGEETEPKMESVKVEVEEEAKDDPELYNPRSCYCCKVKYYILHSFYDQLCPECAEIAWVKRNKLPDLSGKVALVTGARIKIGYETGLWLLRCGATVIVTSRFPHDAALRYSKEPDYEIFASRLQVYGLDLRDLIAVEKFTQTLYNTLSPRGLHILINNAAQTVRRPPQYYAHLMDVERTPANELPRQIQSVIRRFGHTHYIPAIEINNNTDSNIQDDQLTSEQSTAISINPTLNINPSAELSQVHLLKSDRTDPSLFPPNMYDVHKQQIDLRTNNSWMMKMHEVPMLEIAEVHAINAIAPFILNSKLKRLMEMAEGFKFIINCSAMEGKFYRFKTVNHPHTNMAKASMNMMTRTSADDYAQSDIYMNSVDTGWITDENPFDRASKIAETGFLTPIDEKEAASRILDPIFMGLETGKPEHGKFFKDFKYSEW